MKTLARAAPYLWYPATIGASLVLFASLLGLNASPVTALYASAGSVGIAVLWLQRRFPARRAWRPAPRELKVDVAFMALVQVGLPQALAAGCALAFAQRMPVAHSAWPRTWPLAVQLALMLLIVDFVRYWIHRACHRVPLLWKLHAVHHSPRILYSLNSGRFHPLEKTIFFCIDSAPFLALGIPPAVMAGYFLLYAANGLFQHSNVRLRYGWLNYVVAGAETHRWHHAREPRVADCNYGATTAIWDLVFGTWRLPRGRLCKEVGIMDAGYPTGFVDQLVVPFRGWQASWLLQALRRSLAGALIRLRLALTLLVQSRRIARASRDPMRVQRALLQRILCDNRDTTFGRRHGFGAIASYEAFARQVPVGDYEALRPYIDAEIERGERTLTEAPPTRYVRTSGSTGKPKDIPLTAGHLESLRRIHGTAVAFQFRNCPEAFDGRILAIVSPACEGLLQSGKPFGSASGIVAGNTPAVVRTKFVLPAEVSTITESRLKYLLILRLALVHRDITYIGTANSTTLLALMALYRQYHRALIDDVRQGTFFAADRLTDSLRSIVRPMLEACPVRADELSALHGRTAQPRIAELWPSLRLVVTWTCASAGTALSALRRELARGTRVLELGYIASEFRATVTLGTRKGAGLPTLETHFFEFAERDRWNHGERQFLTLDRIRKGVDYYIIVTTPSGLYRYFINDLVRVTGFLHGTPLLEFVQKGKGVTSITGEKLYECQVVEAVGAALAASHCASRFVIMLADEDARLYRLYIEPDGGPTPPVPQLARAVDSGIARLNIEYRAKRESERLGPIEAHWLSDGAGDAYKQFCVARGQREGQFKPAALAFRREFAFDIDRFLAAA